MAESNDGKFAPKMVLAKVYLKDASLEAPNSPEIFTTAETSPPKAGLNFKVESQALPDDAYDINLTLTVTAKNDTKTLFLVEVQQAGIFLIRGVDDADEMDRILNVRCPNVLFPYAREAVDNLIVKAGFPPMMIAAIDFQGIHVRGGNRREDGAAAGA